MCRHLPTARVIGIWLVSLLAQPLISRADVPGLDERPTVTFDVILSHIANAESSRAWQTPG